MGLPVRTVTHYEKWVTLLNMCQTMKNVSHCDQVMKRVTFRKIGHAEKLVRFVKVNPTLKNGTHLEKCVTFGKMGHTVKNRFHLEKWVTL